MRLIDNPYIQNIIDKPTIFICGRDEKLRIDTIQPLLELESDHKVEHLYFIELQDDLKEHLNVVLNNEDFTIINNVNEIKNFEQKNIIACGINLFSDDFKLFKKV
jgi:acyl carrier protein